MIDNIDKKIINIIQKDLPLIARPFAEISHKIGITEDECLRRVNRLIEQGAIRRFGATLRHQEAGYNSNAMVAWVVPEEKINETGMKMAEFREVTHCYQRETYKSWKYNLYTMIHGDSKKECHDIAEKISASTGIKEYELLFSEKEFKKTSMEYF